MKTRSFLTQFQAASAAYKQSFVFVRREKLRHWYLIIGLAAVGCMLLVRAVVDAGADWLELQFFGPLHGHIREVIGSRGGEDWEWVSTGVEDVVNGVMFFLGLWVQFKVTKFIVLLALSPLFAVWAEVIAGRTSGKYTLNREKKGWFWSAIRGAKAAVLLLVLEITASMFLGLVFLAMPLIIPVVGSLAWWLLPLVSSAVSVWFYGAAVLDYVWEHRGFGARDSLSQSWSNRGGAFAMGSVFYVSMAIPFTGWLLGPVLGGLMCIASAFIWIFEEEGPVCELESSREEQR